MRNICYYYNKNNVYVANWPGKSVRSGKTVTKIGQRYLGKVIDKEKNIFWTRTKGYYSFDPETETEVEIDASLIPDSDVRQDMRKKKPPVIVDFGDSYFLECLITKTGYSDVIDTIKYKNKDTLYAMLFYYMLDAHANCHAESWYKNNYVSYLYPKANIYSQRISDFLSAIGADENKREFLLKHIEYLLEASDNDLCVLIDSTGMPNSADLSITRLSVHEGQKNIEFRLIAVVQKSTGLPVYYEYIDGNIIDITTVHRLIETLKQYNCPVQYVIGDCGYCCPSVMERMILSGIEFMTRLNPVYTLYKNAVEEHSDELNQPDNVVQYHGRYVHIVKIPTVIGTDTESGEEHQGFIYLCKDNQANTSKMNHLYNSRNLSALSWEQIQEKEKSLGVFAIVSSRDMKPEEVLPEYYIRQSVEQYFDYGKNYAKFLPVREHSLAALKGHLLLSFIATFLTILIKNRMKIIDSPYISVPCLRNEAIPAEDHVVAREDHRYITEQRIAIEIKNESPSSLFAELRCQKADIYNSAIIPTVPVKNANCFYQAFNLQSPRLIHRKGSTLIPDFLKEGKQLTRSLVFARKPFLSDDEINELKQQPTTVNEVSVTETDASDESSSVAGPELNEAEDSSAAASSKRGKGRPKGSKNRKTLEREAYERDNPPPPKRKPGRPKGAKNKPKVSVPDKQESDNPVAN